MSEQIPFNLQYVRGIGSVLAPVYGGAVEEWARCGIDMLETLEAQYIARFRDEPTGYNDWYATIHRQAMELVFGGMGLPVPDQAEQLSRDTQRQALAACNATFPGASQAVHTLKQRGYTLHTASGNDSGHLRHALAGNGLDTCFDRFYGPDLVDCAKESQEFYRRIFNHLNLPPAHALIIDNDPKAIAWAQSAGAKALQVDLLPYKQVAIAPGIVGKIRDMTQLPTLIELVSEYY